MKKTLLSLSLSTALFSSLFAVLPTTYATASAVVAEAAEEQGCLLTKSFLAELGDLRNFMATNNAANPQTGFLTIDAQVGDKNHRITYDPTTETITVMGIGRDGKGTPIKADAQTEAMKKTIQGYLAQRQEGLDLFFGLLETNLLIAQRTRQSEWYADRPHAWGRKVSVENYQDAAMSDSVVQYLKTLTSQAAALTPLLATDYNPQGTVIGIFLGHAVLGSTATNGEISTHVALHPVPHFAFNQIMSGVLIANDKLGTVKSARKLPTLPVKNQIYQDAMQAVMVLASDAMQHFLLNPEDYRAKVIEAQERLQTLNTDFEKSGVLNKGRDGQNFALDHRTFLSKATMEPAAPVEPASADEGAAADTGAAPAVAGPADA